MTNTRELVAMLESALADSKGLEAAIARYQKLVWDMGEDEFLAEPREREIFRQLAYDLDFFVADADSRAEDSSYYGADRAKSEIETALRALGARE